MHPEQHPSSRRLVNPKAAKLPVRILIRAARLLTDIVDTRPRTRCLLTIKLLCPCKLPTQIDVRNDALVPEVARDITVRAREIRQCLAPRRRVRRGACRRGVRRRRRDVRRNTVAREEPRADPGVAQLHGIHASAVAVERLAERGGLGLDAAAGIAVGAVVAVGREGGARLLPLDGHGAALRRVQRHLVPRRGRVGRLEDVNLAVRRPVGLVGQPQRRPGRAAVWRVEDVEDEQAGVVRVLRLDPDRLAARRRVCVRKIDAQDC